MYYIYNVFRSKRKPSLFLYNTSNFGWGNAVWKK